MAGWFINISYYYVRYEPEIFNEMDKSESYDSFISYIYFVRSQLSSLVNFNDFYIGFSYHVNSNEPAVFCKDYIRHKLTANFSSRVTAFSQSLQVG